MRRLMKQVISILIALSLALTCAWMALGEETNIVPLNAEAMQEEVDARLLEELGAFEITAEQRELARENEVGYAVLDAGRGNPNWINTQSRYALTRFMNFAIKESALDFQQGAMAGHARQEGIGERFDAAMDPEDDTDAFLIDAVRYSLD